VRVAAAAKINLSLEVLGKRADGYHELRSLMQEVTLFDEIEVERATELLLEIDDPALQGEDNLVTRAARLAKARWQQDGWCRVRLEKRIPVAAGLGGGSSDAAATLIALGRLWHVVGGCERYRELAVSIGSDVPFFLYGGRALVEGRGERVQQLPDGPQRWYLLVNPNLMVSTASIFAQLQRCEWTDGGQTYAMAHVAANGQDPGIGINGLQPVLFRLYPAAEKCFQLVDELAPGRTIVSGSGPTVVSTFASAADARAASERLASLGYWTAVVRNRLREGDVPCP
jgi:4-diphosphocytidyl-2-C-methyl-D-erythritol kinase